jgi:hypothetical protein
MRQVGLLIFLLVFSSCNQSRKIEGIWIGCRYQANMGEATFTFEEQEKSNFNYIIEVNQDSLRYANLINFKAESDFNDPLNIKHLRLNDIPLLFDTNHFYLNYSKGDFEIKTPGLSNKWVLLTRLSDKYKASEDCIELFKGIYQWTTISDTFYLNVVNDTLVSSAMSLMEPFYHLQANIFRYDGLNFFTIISQNNALVYIITACDENRLILIRPDDRISKYDSVFLTPNRSLTR